MSCVCVTIIVALAIIAIRTLLRYGVYIHKTKENMYGKVVIVTGANSGIGFNTALFLAKRGARVILACRNESRGTKARDEIIARTGNHNVVYKNLDLASLKSVREFCKDINETENQIDVLVNNAGVYGFGDRMTADGIIVDMQINYFGPFLLTNLLLPKLISSGKSRIVNVTSVAQYFGRCNVDKLNVIGAYYPILAYANNKLCDMMFTVELAERLKNTGVTVNAVHPGIIRTSIISDTSVAGIAFSALCWLCQRDAWEGAQTLAKLCMGHDCANVSGKLFIDGVIRTPAIKCFNKKVREDLWKLSEKLTSEK